MTASPSWHALVPSQVWERLSAAPAGLSVEEDRRRLLAVETLGASTVIISDKTGTQTRDEMTARTLWVGGREIASTGSGYRSEGRFTIDGAAIRQALPEHDVRGAEDRGLAQPTD